jgi:predicted outer membrane repeat protein
MQHVSFPVRKLVVFDGNISRQKGSAIAANQKKANIAISVAEKESGIEETWLGTEPSNPSPANVQPQHLQDTFPWFICKSYSYVRFYR